MSGIVSSQSKLFFHNLNRWLFLSFVLSLFISISLMDVLLGFMTIIFLWKWSTDRSVQTLVKPVLSFFSAFMFFIGIVIAGFFLNASPEAPILTELLRLRWALFPLVLFFYWQTIRFSEKDLKVYLWGLCLLGVFGFYQHFSGYEVGRHENPMRWWTHGGFRVSGFLGSPILFAHCLALHFVYISAAALSMQKFKRLKGLIFASLFLLGLSLLLSFTRGVWAAVVVAVFLQAFLVHWKKGLTVFVLLSGLFSISYFTIPYVKNRVHSFVDQKDQSNSDRILLWQTNLDIFKEHPLLGVGLNENQRRIVEFHQKFGRPQGMEGHAHNEYLQILAGTGLLGFLSLAAFFFQFLVSTLRNIQFLKQENQPFIYVLNLGNFGALIVFFIGAMTEANLERAAFRNGLVLVLGATLYVYIHLKNLSASQLRER